ncbi:MAG: DUF4394 domain-containing protein [Fimbriimonadaceae bacterium]|nr:DUF4394 domain-containing protein [Chitinophagales bacterium]
MKIFYKKNIPVKHSGLTQAIVALFLFASLLLINTSAKAQTIYAINGINLISFDAASPGTLSSDIVISGITSGQSIYGLDVRPNTGQLFALGYDVDLQTAQIYILDPATGIASAVSGTPISIILGPVGTTNLRVGFDFNPTVDRIRVVSNFDYNYRLNPGTGLISFTDLNLNYAVTDVNAGVNPNVFAVAYTNSYIGSTSTTLYDIDFGKKVLAKQDPPNNGTLNTIASVNINVRKTYPRADLDIFFNPVTQTNTAYLLTNSKTAGGRDKLATVDLTTGSVTMIGLLPFGVEASHIACAIDRTLPDVTGTIFYAVNTNNFLLEIDNDNPGVIRSAKGITGLTINQTIVGMDYRPATSELYALGYYSVTNESQLYTINTSTGTATVINVTPTTLLLGGNNVGVDFNPTVDKIRIVSANNNNYRINVDGTLAFTDLNLNYAAADVNFGADPQIGAAAYTNSFAGSTITSLYDYDQSLNIIAQQNPPNDGTLTTIGSSGISQNLSDATTDLDIYYDGSANITYLVANTGTSNFDNLYSVDLSTGAATDLGKIGFGIGVKNIAFPIMEDDMKLSGAGTDAIELKLNIFPNPAHDLLTMQVTLKEASQVNVKVFDIFGNDTGIATEQSIDATGNIFLNISSLPSGTYTIKANTESKTITKTFLKI